jgi:hypothetical protein
MRKLMLIAAIALMTATPCYANLSLASAETSPAATEQPKTTAAIPTKTPVAETRHARPERSARTSKHPQYHWADSRFSYYRYFRGGC